MTSRRKQLFILELNETYKYNVPQKYRTLNVKIIDANSAIVIIYKDHDLLLRLIFLIYNSYLFYHNSFRII